MSEKIHVDAFWRSLNKNKEELCGDRVMIRRTDDMMVAVVADGLGSGVKANILSTLTSTIISEIIYAGLPLQDAVETILSTLPMDKDRGIAFSTFTIVQIFYDGRAFISQSENPDLVMLRNGKVYHIPEEKQVIAGRKVRTSELRLQPDDIIVVCSDGIEHAGLGISNAFGWGVKGLERFLEDNYQEDWFARHVTSYVLDEAYALYQGKPGDDSTVACMRIVEAQDNRIMIGPPSSMDSDDMVVNKLVSCKGIKICCGGSTSSMVARVTGRELRPESLLKMIPGVPPKGYIDGIDLVTEGVLTLQQVNIMMRRALNDLTFLEDLLDSIADDGASMLARTLLSVTQMTFMVGLSDNPSHNAIAYSPISLKSKLNVIDEIAECMKKMGKIISIEKY